MALFMTTPGDMAPEEQVVHNVIPLKDKMPPLGFSDVHRRAKSSLTVTFVRCQSDASHNTDAQLFTAGLLKTPLPLTASVRGITLERWTLFLCAVFVPSSDKQSLKQAGLTLSSAV